MCSRRRTLKILFGRFLVPACLLLAGLQPTSAGAQTQIKARAMVMVDTSGSMVWRFGDCNTTGGDGGNPALYCDNNLGNGYSCAQACTLGNGALPLFPTTLQNPSRLYAAKAALYDVLNSASGSIDFGLERYAVGAAADFGGLAICNNAQSCCTPAAGGATGRCVPQALNGYPNVPGSTSCVGGLNSPCNLTWAGGCGSSRGCVGGACATTTGGQILIAPGSQPAASLLKWVDFVEDFCDSAGSPRNPELRAQGATPLAGSIRTARLDWYKPILDVSKGPGLDTNSPLYDPKIDCRPYVNVVMTDGVESCEDQGGLFTDPTTAVQELSALNPTNPVKTYVIGMAFNETQKCNPSPADKVACPKTGPTGGCTVYKGQNVCSCNTDTDCGSSCEINDAIGGPVKYVCKSGVCQHPALDALNAMAVAGGTTRARFASNQIDIEAAFADIEASTVRVERCNGIDDDCNGACDEGFPDVALSGSCSNGPRAAKTCDNGALAGTKCHATGSFVCSSDGLGQACDAPSCATDSALCPTVEVCNGIDDDCNGVIDDLVPFVPQSACNNCPACAAGGPFPETCDGCDNDCNGTVDDNLIDDGLNCGSTTGVCTPGQTYCCQEPNPTTGTCTQDQTQPPTSNQNRLVCLGGNPPGNEVCDGVDNDCDGTTDGISGACYPFGSGTPGQGACKSGTQSCTATPLAEGNPGCPMGWPAGKTCPGPATYGACSGAVGPSNEICNGFDDDCDGTSDENLQVGDVPWIGGGCCPTGNVADCDPMGVSGTACAIGAYQCVNASKTCVGGVARSMETCDGADNDCDGTADNNIGGNGAPCTAAGIKTAGICRATYVCTGSAGSGPNGLTCDQTVPPGMEVCNNLDDDCDGAIDNGVASTDPRVGVKGGPPCMALPVGKDKPPCDPGTTVCVNGAVVCQGAVQPVTPEICNGVDDDCDGVADNQAQCPTGFDCQMGMCASACGAGEFPCPGGFACDPVTNLCIPDACAKTTCPAGFICQIDTDGNPSCLDPCTRVNCPAGYKCKEGVCADDSCKTFGCPDGQVCKGLPPTCQNDPCYMVDCPQGQFCNSTGQCVGVCDISCPSGQICVDGMCTADPCGNTVCPAGQVCAVSQGVGTCVANLCQQGCNPGSICCGGTCVGDPCANIGCPQGAVCTVNSACSPTCETLVQPEDEDQIVGAGGGGITCAVAGVGARSGGSGGTGLFALAALFGLGALLRRRRESELGVGRWLRKEGALVRSLMMLGLIGIAFGASGCRSDPFCLNCTDPNADLAGIGVDLSGGSPDLAPPPPDFAEPPDLVEPDSPCIPSNGGVETCDGNDNDCNGVVNDVSAAKLAADPNNCGACGNQCDYVAQHQFGACVAGAGGAPTCMPSGCLPGFVDVDPLVAGCEYACNPTVPATEVCDGRDNDCNGTIDDGFGYPNYEIDTNNCGACGLACNLPGGVNKCQAGGAGGKGMCAIDHCYNDATNGTWRHNPASGNRDVTGCEVHCAVQSTTVTSGSDDCDNTSCSFPVETCNGVDDDCDFTVDDAPTDLGACGSCPGGVCQGICKLGAEVCSNGVKLCMGAVPPDQETCDGIDNDCNGTIDDGYGYPTYATDPNNCGACNTACNLANAVNGCQAGAGGQGECYVVECKDSASAGYAYVASQCASGLRDGPTGCGCNYACPVWPKAPGEVCDGKDNDCNGTADDSPTQPSNFCSTQGVCGGGGIPLSCTGAGGWKCDYSGVANVDLDASGNLRVLESRCDGADNNCNGVIDLDGFPTLTQSCVVGVGVCRNTGNIVCTTSTTAGCSVSPLSGNAKDETCNGEDDNCNGLTDEATDYTDPNTMITYKGWRDPMVKVPKPGGGSVYVYAYEASRPDATSGSPGSLSGRACSKPTVLPWANLTQTQAAAACSAVLDSKGQPMRLCSATEWQAACEGPGGAAAEKYSKSTTPGSYQANVCNDDSGAGAPWATASSGLSSPPLCYTDWTTEGQIHDLSGNVGEWTSTSVLNAGTTYYRVRGGDYTSPGGGTTCEFDFGLAQPGFASGTVGFRCCADNPSCGDTASDPDNCGACGNACVDPQVCSGGVCTGACAGGETDCDRACVDLQTDEGNCGACDNVCQPGKSCVAGACVCPAGTMACGSACVNTQTNPNNCGACGVICAGGQVCSGGTCMGSCPGGTSNCGGSCVDDQTDEQNCGGCGIACGASQTCAGGACCASGSVCNGACVDLQSSDLHCGSCGNACSGGGTCQSGICCAVGQTNCNGVCVDLQSDKDNCNACGNVCADGTCVNGSCCDAGLNQCGAQCVDLVTDDNNCGACFVQCAGGTTCQGGGCCPTGEVSCGGQCTDTNSDINNCGACGNACGTGTQCIAGQCTCPPYHSYCDVGGGEKKCIPTSNDPKNCGGCGTTCGGGSTCYSSECVSSCSPNGYTGCAVSGAAGTSCTDLQADRNNCGGCGTVCSTSQGCLKGSCTTQGTQTVPIDLTMGGICGSDGVGPPIVLSTSSPPRDPGGGTCSGDTSATTFTFGICACETYDGGGSQTISAFDSTNAPYVAPGLNGGSIGVNSSFTNSSSMTITGDLVAFSALNLGNTTINQRLSANSTVNGGTYTIGGSATMKSPLNTSNGSTGNDVTVGVDKNLYTPVCPPPGTWSALNGGSCVVDPANVQLPCKRCAGPDQVPIAAYIANYKTQNDNSLIGLSSAGLVGAASNTVVTLPCGYFFLSGISSSKNIQINVQGNTALFIEGGIAMSGGGTLSIHVAPQGRLDLFVGGTIDLTNGARFGDMNVPANMRVYVAGVNTGWAFRPGNPQIFALGSYTPNGSFNPQGNMNFYGAMFAKDYIQGSGSLNMFYDKAFAGTNLVCPPPTGGCTSCLDCSNQACVGAPAGTCGGCSNDGQCCAPLRCVIPNGSSTGSCQFTSF